MKRDLMRMLALTAMMALMSILTLHVQYATADFKRPTGIFLIGKGDGMPHTEAMNKSFIDGYTLRTFWKSLEPVKDQYTFTYIDNVINALQDNHPGKKLNIEIIGLTAPDYILNDPNVKTYRASDGSLAPVTWDEIALSRWEKLCQALANHKVRDKGKEGGLVRLADHSVVYAVCCSIVGLCVVRDLDRKLVSVPGPNGYERTKFINAAIRSLKATGKQFPNKFTFVGFFDMRDDIFDPRLDKQLLDAIRAKAFSGSGQPRMGLFMENLACSTPNISFAWALHQERFNTYTMFQALQSWVKPHFNPTQTDTCLSTRYEPDRSAATSGPEIGMNYAFDPSTYNCRFFEMYLDDILHDGFQGVFKEFHNKLWATSSGQ